jgi:SAM-dependent methyltransferase
VTVHAQTAYFDALAELFDRFATDTDPIYRDWVERTVPTHGHRAVDLGCGSGRFAGLLAARYGDVLAVDISRREIDIAEIKCHHPNVDYRVRSLLEVTPEEDGLFDLVFSVNAIHHLRDHARVLPHVKRLVAPGGHVVIVVIVDPGEWHSRDWHIAEAFRDAEASYRHRTRTAEAAADVLRLRLDPAWLDHVLTDIPLTREGFHRAYATHFPGATFTDNLDPVVAAVHWQAPKQSL